MANPEISQQRQNEFEEIEGNALGELTAETYELAKRFVMQKVGSNDSDERPKYNTRFEARLRFSVHADYGGEDHDFIVKLSRVDDALVAKVEGVQELDGLEGEYSVNRDDDGQMYLEDTREIGRYSLEDMISIMSAARNRYSKLTSTEE